LKALAPLPQAEVIAIGRKATIQRIPLEEAEKRYTDEATRRFRYKWFGRVQIVYMGYPVDGFDADGLPSGLSAVPQRRTGLPSQQSMKLAEGVRSTMRRRSARAKSRGEQMKETAFIGMVFGLL